MMFLTTSRARIITRRQRATMLLGGLAVISAALTGCSASSQTAESQDSGSAASQDSGSASSTSGMTKEQALSLRNETVRRDSAWLEKFDACLARNGVKDTGPAQNKDPRFQTVSDDCTKEVGDAEPFSADELSAIRMLTKLTFDCLRNKGADIPDLTADGNFGEFPADFDWKLYDTCADGGTE
ncbi:hypothetical protein [Agreia bicolorata]|uniref:Secreted protein n=1 Tax=Agreia bicolorata TaxID=110935 RepID=A0ABR5CCL3_9MICO|nr:hypothetical protein [Agreia bicolorata]KJC63291.1 hypothetical protein TZ00_16690 [Agreia bicolorata]